MENNNEPLVSETEVEEINKELAEAEPVTFERNELNKNSFGGTEQMMERIYRDLPADLLKDYQIVASRVRELKGDKLRVIYCHDLADDPEAKAAFDLNGSWTRFHRSVFVSHWQRQQFFNKFPDLAWSHTNVIHNSIEPIEKHEKPKDKINLIYHTTPHRGLNILVAVMKELCKKHNDIHLDVYSSFEIYGWKERDESFKGLFQQIEDDPHMTYHGFKPNSEVREALKKSHVFVYPSIWPETSCIALMEAMSAGLHCVHPDFAALPETAANWTMMYGWHEDMNAHAARCLQAAEVAIDAARTSLEKDNYFSGNINSQLAYINLFNNWEVKKHQWEAFLRSFANEKRDIQTRMKVFQYRA